MTLGEKIRYLRKKEKMSQKQLGTLLGMHENHIGRYENEQSVPTSPVVRRLCEIFKVSADYLLFDEIEKNISDDELFKLFQKIETFDERDKAVIKTLIDAFIARNEMKKIIG